MPRRFLPHALDPVERWTALDPVSDLLDRTARPLLAARWRRNLLSGVPTGHPVHPALAQLSVGMLTSATVLRVHGGHPGAARLLTALGVLSAGPTAAAGLSDWTHGHEQQKRTGVVHAAANAVALALFGASLAARSDRTAAAGAVAGLGALTTGAYVGGHLAFRQALGANHAEHVPHRLSADWTRLSTASELPLRTPVQRMLGDQPLLVYRDGESVQVFSDVCPHLSAPLHEGAVRDGCIVCPWHGSTFALADGEVVVGPATAPVPVLEVRVTDDDVMVRLPGAG